MSRTKHAVAAYYQQAVRLHLGGQREQAARMYQEILAVAPKHADSLHMLGILALENDQPPLALECFDAAIATRPRIALYHVNRASALHRMGRSPEAADACAAAIRLDRACAEAHQMLGHVRIDLGDTGAALAAYRDAARWRPALPDIHNNLGIALRHAGRPEDAESAFREALRREPGDPGATANLANILKELGRPEEAEAGLRAALRADPANPVLRYNLGLLLLLLGRFEEGWDCYESRAAAGAVAFPTFRQPRWQGKALAGSTLLVHTEQGLGATIQFARFVSFLARREQEAQIIFYVQPSLVDLLTTLPGNLTIVGQNGGSPAFNVVCALQSLPRLLGARADLIANTVPYLSADATRVAAWRERLGPGGFRVGIAWQGNPVSAAELGRSIPLSAFASLSKVPGVRLISLQKHVGLEQLVDLPPGFVIETLGEDFDSGPGAFLDTAAVLHSLDLVIVSDSAVAHLAGALARPAWVVLQHIPDWRWMLDRSDSPWYPTMRLYRQPARGDWASVFARIAADLAALVRARG